MQRRARKAPSVQTHSQEGPAQGLCCCLLWGEFSEHRAGAPTHTCCCPPASSSSPRLGWQDSCARPTGWRSLWGGASSPGGVVRLATV